MIQLALERPVLLQQQQLLLLEHLVDSLYGAIEWQRASIVMQHTPDERLAIVWMQSLVLG